MDREEWHIDRVELQQNLRPLFREFLACSDEKAEEKAKEILFWMNLKITGKASDEYRDYKWIGELSPATEYSLIAMYERMDERLGEL